MECELYDTFQIGTLGETGAATLVIGKIVCVNVNESILNEKGKQDLMLEQKTFILTSNLFRTIRHEKIGTPCSSWRDRVLWDIRAVLAEKTLFLSFVIFEKTMNVHM